MGILTEEELFAAAIQAPLAERGAFLDRACGQDAALRAQVESLLAAHEHPDSLLEVPACRATIDTPPPITEGQGTIIGPYKLLQQIGEGGMGVVYMAEQQEPVRRKVALKVIKPGMDTRQVIARFEAERQALAVLDHPNIARVLDAGATESGRPYFVMELVRGTPITQYCDDNNLPVRERLTLFASVCQAIQHAHTKGIIHRDIKPTNVMVTRQDGQPVVKVIDFGIAKAMGQQLTEKTLFTDFAQMIGTPLYMSPEQAELSGTDIDTRSDIYSLGVLLFELLTGSTPVQNEQLKKAAFDEIRRIIREEDPPKPSMRISTAEAAPSIAAQRHTEPAKLARLVRGELDWIVMKALEKDRSRRYETASGFAADVQRYLNDEPVQACPPSAGYRLRKFARRNKVGLAIGGMILFFIVSLGGGVGWVVRDRAARNAKAVADLTLSLERAELLQNQGKRAESLAALAHAELLFGEARPDPVLTERLTTLRGQLDAEAQDQEFVAQFEAIRRVEQSRSDHYARPYKPEESYPKIKEAFQRFGIEIGVTAPTKVASRIRGRPDEIRPHLIAALHECLQYTAREDAQTRQWFNAVLNDADDDPWRIKVRTASAAEDWPALAQLAREADVYKQSPSFLMWVGRTLPPKYGSTRLDLLRRTQRAHAGDFRANCALAGRLRMLGYPADAVRYYTAALAVYPDHGWTRVMRALALQEVGEVEEAIADLHHVIAAEPNHSSALYHLGNILRAKGDLEGAIEAYRTSNTFSPNGPKGQYFLGLSLLEQGRYAEAMVHLRRAHDLGSPAPDWLCPAAVSNCETLVKLDTRLPDLLAGEQEPANVQERITLAGVCLGKRQFERAARYFDEAFSQEPGLTKDVICCQWYDAACAAAMASIGEGDDASLLSDEQRTHRRRQALGWLRIDLLRRSALDRHSMAIFAATNLRLEAWLHESALKGLRDEEYLANLPAEEREACVKLWKDVRELLDRAKIPRWKSFSPRS